jgi:predicted TIM-barrel fold metal-dependent hydrolase
VEEITRFKNEIFESCYKDIPVFDCHTHIINKADDMEKLLCLKGMFGFEWMNVLSISGMGDIAQNLKCILLKALYPEKNYIFGGLLHSEEALTAGDDYSEQAKRLISMGFDGMKIIEGKPNVRRELNKPLDDHSFDSYYNFLEEVQIPVLFHIADPETFWDINAIPEWARNAGWFYGDSSYNQREDFYREVDGILNKFPRLKAIFAHFYFLSTDMERASEFLDKWSNVSIDLTPGTEMYVNFSKDPEKWREFFIKYQDRIIFGTDTCDPEGETELANMINTVNLSRRFLETDKEFQVWDVKLKGIHLEKEILEKIYYKNFFRYVGKEPKKLNLQLSIAECERMIDLAAKSSSNNDVIDEMKEILSKLIQYQAGSLN